MLFAKQTNSTIWRVTTNLLSLTRVSVDKDESAIVIKWLIGFLLLS